MTATRGTQLHKFAHDAIKLGIKQANNGKTLNKYINDCIGYRMHSEVALMYSSNCFGTADALGFRRNMLRIFDLKNGITPASVKQLEVYAALFCLEYRFKPFEIDFDLRIYQLDEVQCFETDKNAIMHIISTIVNFDKRIRALREEADL